MHRWQFKYHVCNLMKGRKPLPLAAVPTINKDATAASNNSGFSRLIVIEIVFDFAFCFYDVQVFPEVDRNRIDRSLFYKFSRPKDGGKFIHLLRIPVEFFLCDQATVSMHL